MEQYQKRTLSFYGARAKGGVGLIFTECTIVDGERGKGNTKQIGVYDDKYTRLKSPSR